VTPVLSALVAAVLAAVLAAFGPFVLRVLPEPLGPDPDDVEAAERKGETVDPEPDKVLYAELGKRPRLALWLALAAGMYGALAGLWIHDYRLLPAWIVLAAVGVLLAYIDWHTHLLPYLIVAPTWVAVWVLTGLSAWWMGDLSVLKQALWGNLIVFGSFWVLYWFAKIAFGGAFGYGDVRLSAVLGVVLGPLGIVPSFVGIYAGFFLGAIVGLIRQKGRLRGGVPLAFGPFMVVGAVFALLLV
jgi:leader peptidase (prepilin peptidase)/N-methyltransferase